MVCTYLTDLTLAEFQGLRLATLLGKAGEGLGGQGRNRRELDAGAIFPTTTLSQVEIHQGTKSAPAPGLLTLQRPLVTPTASSGAFKSGYLSPTFMEGQLSIISAKLTFVCVPQPSKTRTEGISRLRFTNANGKLLPWYNQSDSCCLHLQFRVRRL